MLENKDKEQAFKYIELDEVKEISFFVQLSDYLHLEKRYFWNWVDHQCNSAYSRVVKGKTKEVVLIKNHGNIY